jgi:hypothetical protein
MTMPGIGIPQEPSLRMLPAWAGVKVPLGEVSVMPQPSLRLQPVIAVNCCATSSGSGAPPDPQYLSVRRLCFGVSGWLISAVNMVGTPQKTLICLLEISSSAVFGSKRTSWMISAPRRTPNSTFTESA